MDTVQVQIRFTIEEEGYPSYTDALLLDLNDYTAGKIDVESLKQERYLAWREAIDNPPSPPEAPVITQEDALVTARQALTDAMAAIDAVTTTPVIDQEK